MEKSTLLHIALNHKSQQENLHKLLQNENLDLHQKDTQGKTPLYVAIEQHYPDIVTFLLDHDVSVLGNMSRADLRKTPLFYALLAGYRDMVVLLLKRPDIFIDLGGSMVDTLASMYKQTNNDRMLSMVRLLLLYGGGFDKKDAVVMAVKAGGDTDTTAAIVGALAGTYYGLDSIPSEYKDEVENFELLQALTEELTNNEL